CRNDNRYQHRDGSSPGGASARRRARTHGRDAEGPPPVRRWRPFAVSGVRGGSGGLLGTGPLGTRGHALGGAGEGGLLSGVVLRGGGGEAGGAPRTRSSRCATGAEGGERGGRRTMCLGRGRTCRRGAVRAPPDDHDGRSDVPGGWSVRWAGVSAGGGL